MPSNLNSKSTKKGFSLVELLVAITILGIIGSAVSITMINHGKKARDAQRKNDLKQVKNALQSAKNDCQNAAYYPYPLGGAEITKYYSSIPTLNGIVEYLSDSNLKYLSTQPKDPKATTTNYLYRYGTPVSYTDNVCPAQAASPTLNVAGISDYILRVVLENTGDPDLKKSYQECKSKFTGASPIVTLFPASVDANSDDIDDSYYYYVCND